MCVQCSRCKSCYYCRYGKRINEDYTRIIDWGKPQDCPMDFVFVSSCKDCWAKEGLIG